MFKKISFECLLIYSLMYSFSKNLPGAYSNVRLKALQWGPSECAWWAEGSLQPRGMAEVEACCIHHIPESGLGACFCRECLCYCLLFLGNLSLIVDGGAMVQSVKGKSFCPGLLPEAVWLFSHPMSLSVRLVPRRSLLSFPFFPPMWAGSASCWSQWWAQKFLELQASSLHIHPRGDHIPSSTCTVSMQCFIAKEVTFAHNHNL